jgi:endonuclease/exonuclease/phosphatase family metal-dependent hydrolase
MPLSHRRRLVAPLALVAALVAIPVAAPGARPAAKPKPPQKITVMSRNLFLGANLLPLATTPAGDDFERAVGKLYDEVNSTEPDARMKIVAGEIAKAKPDLVGLQEVTLWRTGPKNDGKPATDVKVDYLATLMKELKRRKAGYRVVADQRTLDLEAPSDRDLDVRFTDGNVVLARKGVVVSHVKSSDFKNQLVIPDTPVGDVSINRSFNQLDASKGGRKFHFVNAHLEAYSPDFRLKQAKELVAGPLKSKKLPTVLVGDLNSGPKLPKKPDRPPYLAIAAAGYKEARTPKFNCCFHDDLVSGKWDHIVDHIMTRPKFKLLSSFVTGNTVRTPGGKAPSDHGGVVSVLRLP